MDNRIEEIAAQIRSLEEELIEELRKKQDEFFYTLEDRKVKFKENVIKEGRLRVISSIKYLSSFPVLAILTIPFIWSMMIPAFLVDIFVTIYQSVCFPIYKIPKVKRKDYVVIDRYNLFYLDRVEKVNCLYCEYFNGVIGYTREIAARSEQFWCPIKHSKPQIDMHSRYDKFFDFGDYLTYRKELEERRSNFKDVENRGDI
ncbi:MAG: hypothetical protein PHQ93_10445 [Sulfurimonas sp.]|uniref:hypothetical protein n=1 Tax=Sulfurimonas sp. TaxID=2022749 RepID=UPI0026129C86|nr:hypothetical protein [Sulfurimonas sp.]MDD5401596.1 hypothetical protein [Sulfurimonas sp.]